MSLSTAPPPTDISTLSLHDALPIFAAALTSGDSTVVLASSDGSIALREAATGGQFVPPRIDDAGYVWTSTRESSGVLVALSGADPEHDAKIDAPWLSGRRILALDIAADATRMVVLSADTGGARLDLCAVRRDENGVPSALTEPIAMRPSLEDVTQASWYDEVAVLVLGEDSSSGEQRAQIVDFRSEEHTSELQSRGHLVCRLLLEKKQHQGTEAVGGGAEQGDREPATQGAADRGRARQ